MQICPCVRGLRLKPSDVYMIFFKIRELRTARIAAFVDNVNFMIEC